MGFVIEKGILKKYTTERNYISKKEKTKIRIPNNVKIIGKGAFADCENLESIIIPKSIRTIGNKAFCGCKNLKSINIPSSVKKVGFAAFADCKNLELVNISGGVKSIGKSAFSSCLNLRYMDIPKSVTYIGKNAFFLTHWLWNKIDENPLVIINGIIIDAELCEGDIIIPDGITSVSLETFHFNVKSLTIPDSVKNISDYDNFCENLKLIFSHNDITVYFMLPQDAKQLMLNEALELCTSNYEAGKFFEKFTEDNFYKTFGVHSSRYNLFKFLNNPTADNFNDIKKQDYKIPLCLLRFFGYGENEYEGYIAENIVSIANWIIDNENYKLLDAILKTDFVTDQNIDDIIEYAVQAQKTEIYVMLLNYKAENIGFADDEFEI